LLGADLVTLVHAYGYLMAATNSLGAEQTLCRAFHSVVCFSRRQAETLNYRDQTGREATMLASVLVVLVSRVRTRFQSGLESRSLVPDLQKNLTIYHKIIVSLSYDRRTLLTYDVLSSFPGISRVSLQTLSQTILRF